jgi:cytoplasmic iron level regulating protein YaaA (DUF328/UPF0246 family)
MIILLSPAKSLDYDSKLVCKNYTIPHFVSEIEKLIFTLKKLTISDLEKLMTISKKLAELNFERFQNFEKNFNQKNSRQALLAFDGDVYAGIDKHNFSQNDFDFSQNHLRILSGLYGVLKPLDLIQPYRLEMGCDLKKLPMAKNLYQFWGDKISNHLNEESKTLSARYIINLASEEYFSVINTKIITSKIINIAFKEKKADVLKVVGINAKKARGLMTNFTIKNKITNPLDLKNFSEQNYTFQKNLSDESNFVFVR